MKILLNGEDTTVDTEISVKQLAKLTSYDKSSQLIFIKNGFIVKGDSLVNQDDQVFIIPKDMEISKGDLEQFIVSRHSPNVVEKVSCAKVAVLGLGGLGSNIAMQLARTGVKHLRVIDFDIVDPTNINRQNYFLDQIGMKKTDATMDNLKRVNPYIEIEKFDAYLEPENYDKYLTDMDIVVEAFDNPVCKADLTRFFMQNNSKQFLVTASGMAGYYKSNSIITAKLRENIYICGDRSSAAKEFDGLMAPRVSIVAGHQSNCVLRIIMNEMEV